MLNELTGRSLLSRLGTGLATAGVGVALLAGCAAGQHAQTVGQVPAIDGVGADSGYLSIRNAGIVSPTDGSSYPKGGSALLQFVLINSGGAADELVSVTSPAASAAIVSNAGSPDPVDTTSSSASASATPGSPIDVGAAQSVQVGYSVIGPNVALTGLSTTLFPAQSIPVTFTFKSGTAVTTSLAVKLSEGDTAGPSVPAATQNGD